MRAFISLSRRQLPPLGARSPISCPIRSEAPASLRGLPFRVKNEPELRKRLHSVAWCCTEALQSRGTAWGRRAGSQREAGDGQATHQLCESGDDQGSEDAGGV